MRYVSRQERLTQLHRLHHEMCGVNLNVGLYKRLQRLGGFWPKMASDAKEEQRNCNTCTIIPPDQVEVLNNEIQEEEEGSVRKIPFTRCTTY